MMRELILIRHAKSSWDDISLPDHERTLNDRGKRDAPFMATWLSNQIKAPDMVITSTAVRARETADKFINAFGIEDRDVVVTRDVYEANVQDLLDLIAWVPQPDMERVMLVGHNPTMTHLLNHLSNAGIDNMPTCSVGVVEFPDADSWRQLGDGRLKFFERPKTLQA